MAWLGLLPPAPALLGRLAASTASSSEVLGAAALTFRAHGPFCQEELHGARQLLGVEPHSCPDLFQALAGVALDVGQEGAGELAKVLRGAPDAAALLRSLLARRSATPTSRPAWLAASTGWSSAFSP